MIQRVKLSHIQLHQHFETFVNRQEGQMFWIPFLSAVFAQFGAAGCSQTYQNVCQFIRISAECIFATHSGFIDCSPINETRGGAISISSTGTIVDINSCSFYLCPLAGGNSYGGAVYASVSEDCTIFDCCVTQCFAGTGQTFRIEGSTSNSRLCVVGLTALSCGIVKDFSVSGLSWWKLTAHLLSHLNFSLMKVETFGSALALDGNVTISSLTVFSCTGGTAVTDFEPGNQSIEYGNFFNNTILPSTWGSSATITVNFNGLSMSHCCFNGNDADIAAYSDSLERPFSLSHCFFSSSFPNSDIFTIVTECYENITTASWAMQAPTQNLSECLPPCTMRSISPATSRETSAATVARSHPSTQPRSGTALSPTLS
jgi:hypothetical protein